MTFDISKHILVPKHQKLSDTEKEKLFKKLGIEFKELPKILREDPTLIALDVKEGDVIKVERQSETAGDTVYYRGVING